MQSGPVERAAVLAERLVGRIRTDAPTTTLELLGVLRGAGLRTHADSLAENAAWRTPTHAGSEVAELLTGYVRAKEPAADILLERIASESWGDNDPYSVARVLRALCALPTADPDGAGNPAATADPTGSDTERSGSAHGGPARTARSALTTAALRHVAVQARQTGLDNPDALAHLVTCWLRPTGRNWRSRWWGGRQRRSLQGNSETRTGSCARPTCSARASTSPAWPVAAPRTARSTPPLRPLVC
ncbi:hypothetical protein RKD18_000270 [Streptomyces phaeoluteigriseus]